MKLSDFVFSFLAKKGVKHVFMLPGGGAMHLNDSLGHARGMEFTCFAHEQALAIAAEAYGQNTNFPGVALVTSGPGGTNCVTAVAAAFIDSTPCFFLSGQAKRADLKGESGVRQMGPQEVDIVGMVKKITKYAVTILDPGEVLFHLEKAWSEATTGRKGPVWLDIPLDVQAAEVDPSALRGFARPDAGNRVSAESAAQVISLLHSAKRPVILAGNGVKADDAQEDLRRFAEHAQIPVLLTWKAIDFLDYDHELNFGSPGVMGLRSSNFILQNSDFVLILGCRLDSSITAFNLPHFAPYAKKVMVDIDEAELKKVSPLEVAVCAGAGEFLGRILERLEGMRPSERAEWLRYCRGVKARYPVVLPEYRECRDGINQYVFTEALFGQLNERDVITPESSGAAGEVTYQALKVKKGQKIKNAAGLGAMGFGLPYAIGACIANSRRRTILINGDGAFVLNIQELETVRRLGLPVKMFILDNGGYASIRATQDNLFEGHRVGSDAQSGFTIPNLAAVGAAFGIRHEHCSAHEDMTDAIARTLAGADPALCIVKITPSQVTAPRVKSMKTPEGSMKSMPLEEMWPYLSPEETAENMIARKSKS